ncbi:zinc finger protein 511 isoform X1 [Anguilla anguilla]|uniref:zinc finger protein 511 isoform X1 n=1 Tax=Anguilla anguilla TaxID=7936 RepID=UPI0015AF7A7F|nr:zinc finger protein 511 isoform X1 [Anguilla anguilla]
MLQSELLRFLIQTESVDTDILAIPVLQADTKPKEPNLEKLASVCGDDGTEEIGSPFTFTPQQIRLSKDHEMFEDGDIHRHLYLQDVATTSAEVSETPTVSAFRCHIAGCSQLFDTLEGYEHHYSSLHRHVCSSCRRSFPSDRLLDIHILEWHDSYFQIMAEKQSMYQCLVEGCDLKFKTSKERKNHLIKIHRYPPDFRFDRSKKSKSRTQEKTPPKSAASDAGMEVSVATDAAARESEPGESMEFCASSEHDGQKKEEQPKPRYSYRVPHTICFGQGSTRGFRGSRRKK